MVKLYKVPGSYVFGFVGAFGTGKSLAMTELGLQMANFFEKPIVSSYRLSIQGVYHYCKQFNLKWIVENIQNKSLITYYPGEEKGGNLVKILSSENSILLLDEAGVELFSRGFADSGRKQWLDKLFRIRHYNNHLLYACQDTAQIDKQFRIMTKTIIYCDGLQIFNMKRKAFDLQTRKYFVFDDVDFEKFYTAEFRNKIIYPLYKSGWRFSYRILFLLKLFGLRKIKEDYLFDCYNSYDKFETNDKPVTSNFNPNHKPVTSKSKPKNKSIISKSKFKVFAHYDSARRIH